ncbi:hypothetical protein Cgig2_003016 [Carnegiea gigantea]|uniref:Uncharacterized protein n=1 Tax=Carnegiea gigantea TaxID=171969 RepID=A0A9Q1JLW5_9CARY|nr:hypothetical protein Cgig2_003016 [Carnegiea gigantea]
MVYTDNFLPWDSRGLWGPPRWLTEAEGDARYFHLPELPQVKFYTMLLNEAARLGMLGRWTVDIMESALTELRWSTFKVWVPHNRGKILEARHQEVASSDEEESSGSEGAASSPSNDADHVRETFKWHLRRASRPPRPLLEEYQDLCLSFTLPDTEEAAHDFAIPEIVQGTFYALVVNDAVELSEVSRDMAGALKLTLKGLCGLLSNLSCAPISTAQLR